jgi:hypothetical protein
MNKEKLIQEQRTIEAMKNGFMGLEGKPASVAKRLGYAILQQGSGDFQQSFVKDFYGVYGDEDDMPTMDDNDIVNEIGFSFDGYGRGVNMSIVVMHMNADITVNYEGRVVYKESGGELMSYVPNGEWEGKLESFYIDSLSVDKVKRAKDAKVMASLADTKRNEILNRLRDKWGV